MRSVLKYPGETTRILVSGLSFSGSSGVPRRWNHEPPRGDPITGAMAPVFQAALPGAKGVEHPVIADAGHFLQEDAGEDLAGAIVAFLGERA